MSFHVPGDIPDLQSLHLEIRPVVLAGDFNVMPTELDVYKPERGSMTRSSAPRSGSPSAAFDSGIRTAKPRRAVIP